MHLYVAYKVLCLLVSELNCLLTGRDPLVALVAVKGHVLIPAPLSVLPDITVQRVSALVVGQIDRRLVLRLHNEQSFTFNLTLLQTLGRRCAHGLLILCCKAPLVPTIHLLIYIKQF